MTSLAFVAAASLATLGVAVVLTALRPAIGAGTLRSRLAPHVPGSPGTPDRSFDPVASAARVGARIAAALGTGRDFERRLRLAGEADAASFRARQVAWTGAAAIVAAAFARGGGGLRTRARARPCVRWIAHLPRHRRSSAGPGRADGAEPWISSCPSSPISSPRC